MQKEIVLLTTYSHKWSRKNSPLHLNSPLFIQKRKTFGLPLDDLWASPTFQFQNFCLVVCAHNLYNMLHFKLKFKSTLWRGISLVADEIFPKPGPLLLWIYSVICWSFWDTVNLRPSLSSSLFFIYASSFSFSSFLVASSTALFLSSSSFFNQFSASSAFFF